MIHQPHLFRAEKDTLFSFLIRQRQSKLLSHCGSSPSKNTTWRSISSLLEESCLIDSISLIILSFIFCCVFFFLTKNVSLNLCFISINKWIISHIHVPETRIWQMPQRLAEVNIQWKWWMSVIIAYSLWSENDENLTSKLRLSENDGVKSLVRLAVAGRTLILLYAAYFYPMHHHFASSKRRFSMIIICYTICLYYIYMCHWKSAYQTEMPFDGGITYISFIIFNFFA